VAAEAEHVVNPYFLITSGVCLILLPGVIVATRRALRDAGREITYPVIDAGEPRRPRGYRPAHRRRTTSYIGRPQPTPSDFADIAAANPIDVDVATYAALYLVPEETR